MNEHIAKLLTQATYDVLGVKQVDQKLFAELIVRECADFLDTFNRENMVEEGIGGAELKEHFGVEE